MARNDRTVVVFVDDDPKEIEIFKNVFGSDFHLLTGTRAGPVIQELGSQRLRPRLFVLDLYFPKGPDATKEQRQEMIRLRQEVEAAQAKLSAYLAFVGQGPDGGITTLEHIRQTHPTTPVVFYTRKGTLDDVAKCRDAGAVAVLRKPHPIALQPHADVYEEMRKAAKESKEYLVRQFEQHAASPSLLVKMRRLIKFVWNNWGKF